MAGPGGYLVFGDSVNIDGMIHVETVLDPIDNPRLDSFDGWDMPYYEYVSGTGGNHRYVSGASVSMPYTYRRGTVRRGAANGYAIINHYVTEARAQQEADAFNAARQPGDLSLAGIAFQQYGQYSGLWRCYYQTYNHSTVEWETGELVGYIFGNMPVLQIRSITMDPALIMYVDETTRLVPTVNTYPAGVQVTISWASSNPWVCDVDGGYLTAYMVGYTLITATTGGMTAECAVNVILRPGRGGCVYVYDGGRWKKAKPYIRDGAAWKETQAHVSVSGSWKKTKEV